jgi:hypothetical protein
MIHDWSLKRCTRKFAEGDSYKHFLSQGAMLKHGVNYLKQWQKFQKNAKR